MNLITENYIINQNGEKQAINLDISFESNEDNYIFKLNNPIQLDSLKMNEEISVTVKNSNKILFILDLRLRPNGSLYYDYLPLTIINSVKMMES